MKKVCILLTLGIVLLVGTTVLAGWPVLGTRNYDETTITAWPEPGTGKINDGISTTGWPEPGTGK